MKGSLAFVVGLVLSINVSPVVGAESGTLKLTIRDAATGELVPARLHVKDASGMYRVANDAMMFGGDCDMSDAGAGYTNLVEALRGFTDRLENPYTGTTQFYTEGTSEIGVQPGRTEIAVFKGPEYRISTAEVDVAAGATVEHEIRLERWVDMPAKGWFSADDHLHIQRPHPDLNSRIIKMMQAEDLHVANLLQMGKVRNFQIAPQYKFGEGGHYQRGNYILAAGQENPRTHFLGHTITLGATEPIFNADKYLVYRLIWEAAVAKGGINGFAHAYSPNGGLISPFDGMAVVLPHNILHFLEVLQFNRSGYAAWYDVLNLGFRVAPTAGTDYPCADQNIPGHERFYTKVDGNLNYAKWLDGIRDGRTFVTTGPMIEFRINGNDIGSDVQLSGSAEVQIEGAVTFDPDRDDLNFVELIQNGSLVHRVSRIEGLSRVAFSITHTVEETSWFALRGYGSEQSFAGFVSPLHFADFNPTSNVHTSPIYVTLKDRPTIQESRQARRVARAWLARLDDLELVLRESNMDHLGEKLANPVFDAVPVETLINNRADLLTEIASAKAFFAALAE